jgi:hypothetical protein
MTDITINNKLWYIKSSPPVAFTHIPKEKSSYGILYCIWEIHDPDILYISQSIPATTKLLSLHFKVKLFSSYFYRVLRLRDINIEPKCRAHYSLDIKKFDRADLSTLNRFLENKKTLIFILKNPEKWKFNPIVRPHPALNES